MLIQRDGHARRHRAWRMGGRVYKGIRDLAASYNGRLFTLILILCILIEWAYGNKGVSNAPHQADTGMALPGHQLTEKPADPQVQHTADDDPVGLLKEGLRRYDASVQDYEGFFCYDERDGPHQKARAVCSFRFRERPLSLTMVWQEGADRADKLLYAAGESQNKMWVHPTGWLGHLATSVAIDTTGPQAEQSASRLIKRFGLRNALLRLLESFACGNEEQEAGGECLGTAEQRGRQVLVVRRKDAKGSVVAALDPEGLYPVSVRKYGPDGQLVSLYEYRDLVFNVGFTDATFSKSANGL